MNDLTTTTTTPAKAGAQMGGAGELMDVRRHIDLSSLTPVSAGVGASRAATPRAPHYTTAPIPPATPRDTKALD